MCHPFTSESYPPSRIQNYEKEQKKISLLKDTLALSDFVSDIGLMTRSKPYTWEDGKEGVVGVVK